MALPEDLPEPLPNDWLELADGGGIMLRDARQLRSPQPAPFRRWRKQLLESDDSAEP